MTELRRSTFILLLFVVIAYDKIDDIYCFVLLLAILGPSRVLLCCL
jgi:hypothetical protein